MFVGLHFGVGRAAGRCSWPHGSAGRWHRWRRSTTRRSRHGSTGPAARPASASSACARRAASSSAALRDGDPGRARRRPRPDRRRDAVPLFGAPARLPLGPAMLAVESGAPAYVVAVRRAARGRYSGHLDPGGGAGRRVAARAGLRNDDEPGRRIRDASSRTRRPSGGPSSSRSGRISRRQRREPAAHGSRGAELRTRPAPALVPARLGRADLHIHTVASDGTARCRGHPRSRGRARRPRRHRDHRPRAHRCGRRGPDDGGAIAACRSRS